MSLQWNVVEVVTEIWPYQRLRSGGNCWTCSGLSRPIWLGSGQNSGSRWVSQRSLLCCAEARYLVRRWTFSLVPDWWRAAVMVYLLEKRSPICPQDVSCHNLPPPGNVWFSSFWNIEWLMRHYLMLFVASGLSVKASVDHQWSLGSSETCFLSTFPVELHEGDVQMLVEELWKGPQHLLRDPATHPHGPPGVSHR